MAIIVSMHLAIQNCKRIDPTKNPEEPDYVAAIVLDGTRFLENGWNEILKQYNINISISGIFCHQSPMVHYKGMKGKSCEIGDLLWCHFHKKSNGTFYRNAILFQAKRISQLPHYISSSETDQYYLYNKWPQFKYIRSGTLNNQIRKINPSAPRRGAQYLTINENSPGLYGIPNRHPCQACMSDDPLVFHSDLGNELIKLLDFQSGDMFDSNKKSSSSNGWSKVIWDLLDVTAKTIMNRRKSGYKNHSRTSGFLPYQLHGCINMSKLIHQQFFKSFLLEKEYDSFLEYATNDEPPRPNEYFKDDENSGSSAIIIESHEGE